MSLKIIEFGSTSYQKMVDLRFQILRNPLGLTFSQADLDKEKDDILIGFFEEDNLEGCCILTPVNKTDIRLRQMAVISGLQYRGIGRVIMNFAENVARDRGYKVLHMHARKTAVGFYQKLGYEIIGEEFEEVTIPHFEMQKAL
ncbi:MAG: GNAT family N-acetyltransferase [Sediminibacterium sp.]